jgi:hypothetical protein
MLFKAGRFLFRLLSTSFILALPIGYYYENPDSTNVIIGVHGGAGQVATIIRGCEGNKLASTQNTYRDFSASVYFPFPLRTSTPLIIGLRGGSFRSQARSLDYNYSDQTQHEGRPVDLNAWYLNPNFSLEYKIWGLGLGFGLGNMPYAFRDFNLENSDNDIKTFIMSGHLRLGEIRNGHFIISMAENEPRVSGGDMFNIGIGYPAGKKVMMFTGIGGGFCDKAGLVQQARIDFSKNRSLDIGVRLGKSEGVSENAISGGFICKIGN